MARKPPPPHDKYDPAEWISKAPPWRLAEDVYFEEEIEVRDLERGGEWINGRFVPAMKKVKRFFSRL